MNKTTLSIAVLVIAVLGATLTYMFLWPASPPPTVNGVAANAGTNASLNTTTSNSASNQNTNAAATNSNQTPQTTNSAGVNDRVLLVSVADATANPEQYDNRSICLEGYYQSSFEFMALGPTYRLDQGGQKILEGPYVWSPGDDDLLDLDCTNDDRGRICFGAVTVCGTFEYDENFVQGQGYGHVGAYRYQMARPVRPPSSNTAITPANTTS